MYSNFFLGIKANILDINLFITDLIHSKGFVGFFAGFLVAVLVAGVFITKNPKRIPILLRYSAVEAFEKVAKRDKNGTYKLAFTNFVKMYTQIRTLTLITAIIFFTMITTIVITK